MDVLCYWTNRLPNFAIDLVIIIYTQNQNIKRLKSSINTLLKSTQNGEDKCLVYLRESLKHLDNIEAFKALANLAVSTNDFLMSVPVKIVFKILFYLSLILTKRYGYR